MKQREIKVLGGGCANCQKLLEHVKTALAETGMEADVEYVTDFVRIASYGIMLTPALLVDGKTVSKGRVLSVEEIKTFL
ncbi:thioredoxin family protein [uncultured Acidaminococcus sp.]|uniref:thioredoxin family protein n=1 Tax=uncultured Acidaminococcus sp. TaxID=352152 RepID=UPI0025E42F4F|nr:thioredoxin family protein [uncultured Acidaminococcus sp.]